MPKQTLPTCVSGGASGADYMWITTASKTCNVQIMSFEGHHCSNIKNAELKQIPNPTLSDEADPKLEEANVYLKRSNYKIDLLRRNYFIVRDVESCYAIVPELLPKKQNNKCQVRIDGGTAWGCQLFAIKFLNEHFQPNQNSYEIPLYVFSQKAKQWLKAHCSVDSRVKITDIEWKTCIPPKPNTNFAAIGTRGIDLSGKIAIQKLLDHDNKKTHQKFIVPNNFALQKTVPKSTSSQE